MKLLLIFSVLFWSANTLAACNSILDFETKRLHSQKTINFCQQFQGKVLLVVNTASQCGFSYQFKELEALYQKYRQRGFEIVGFPSNDFQQEHDNEALTAKVCYVNYGVSFNMVAPSNVKGEQSNHFFKQLAQATQHSPDWNFNKYLINHRGEVLAHFNSATPPLQSKLEKAVAEALKQKGS
jgi:glutathione peroxidase